MTHGRARPAFKRKKACVGTNVVICNLTKMNINFFKIIKWLSTNNIKDLVSVHENE